MVQIVLGNVEDVYTIFGSTWRAFDHLHRSARSSSTCQLLCLFVFCRIPHPPMFFRAAAKYVDLRTVVLCSGNVFSIAVSVFRPIGFCKLGAFSMMLQHTTLRSCVQPLTLISARIYRASVIGGTCSNSRAIVIGPAFPMCDKFWLCLFDPCHHSSTLSVLPGLSNDANSQYFLHVILTLSSPVQPAPILSWSAFPTSRGSFQALSRSGQDILLCLRPVGTTNPVRLYDDTLELCTNTSSCCHVRRRLS